jgi:ATP-dependent DNA helicase RecG
MLMRKDRAFIVWGIKNVTHEKIGTTFVIGGAKKGGENLSNWLSRMIEPNLMMEFLDIREGDKRFSILVVEPSYDRPVKFAGVAYIRIGENIKPLDKFKEHERALWLATGHHKFESAIAIPNLSVADIITLLDVDFLYKLLHIDRPDNIDEIIRALISRDLIKDNMEGRFDITNLGAILFAREIDKFPQLVGKTVRVVKYVGKDKRSAESENEGHKGYAVGFSGLLSYVTKRIPSEEQYVAG